jgi:hypothetical protein
MWAAVLAKWVAPMDAVRAAKALADMLPGLSAYPDAAFTEASAREIAQTGRIMGDGSRAPLARVPTFGELELVLARWWHANRPDKPAAIEYVPSVYRVDIPKPRDPPTDSEIEHVGDIVHRFKWELETASATREAAEPPRSRRAAAVLSDERLLAIYEQEGEAGALRAAALRRKLGAPKMPVPTVYGPDEPEDGFAAALMDFTSEEIPQ